MWKQYVHGPFMSNVYGQGNAFYIVRDRAGEEPQAFAFPVPVSFVRKQFL